MSNTSSMREVHQTLAAYQIALVKYKRGVNTPCEVCKGWGVKHYSHGSTWRGGMGTASGAPDVCDECWGSGDKLRPWPSWKGEKR